MNNCTFSGRLGRDPEMNYSPQGVAVTKFSIAVQRWKKNGEPQPPMWVNCVAFDRIAENIASWVHQGDLLLLVGQLDIKQYSKNDGVKGTWVELLVSSFDIAARKKESYENQTYSSVVSVTEEGKPF